MGIKFGGLLLVVGLGLSGCSEKVSQCTTNTDCQNPAYPFCDVNGTYAPSDGDKNVCTIVPPDCPIDVCGCSPGAVTCAAGELTTCNTDGMSTTSDACALGCATTNDRCLTFTPANGLGPALTAAAAEPDVVFPSQVTINTDTGEVRDAGGIQVPVSALTATQSGGVSIEVLIAKSFDITNAKVTGANALALVSVGNISIHGLVNMSANMNVAGPGATTTGACVGITNGILGGGGGNATVGGGAHGTLNSSATGGAMQQGFEPLQGGCNGGAPAFGGGGGALQMDSLGTIDLTSTAILNLGGGGSAGDSGGGAGGNVLIEAPLVTVEGNVVGNGGSAGSTLSDCTSAGSDASTDSQAAAGGVCGTAPRATGGAGGTRTIAPTGGFGGGSGGGGGGGAIGRLHVRTQTGSYDHTSGTIGLDDSSEALVLH